MALTPKVLQQRRGRRRGVEVWPPERQEVVVNGARRTAEEQPEFRRELSLPPVAPIWHKFERVY